MRKYLFIPYQPEEAELYYSKKSGAALKREFLELARQSKAKCSFFALDFNEASGLRLLYAVRDGEIEDAKGNLIGKFPGKFC